MVLVLLSTLLERFSVSRMQDFFPYMTIAGLTPLFKSSFKSNEIGLDEKFAYTRRTGHCIFSLQERTWLNNFFVLPLVFCAVEQQILSHSGLSLHISLQFTMAHYVKVVKFIYNEKYPTFYEHCDTIFVAMYKLCFSVG